MTAQKKSRHNIEKRLLIRLAWLSKPTNPIPYTIKARSIWLLISHRSKRGKHVTDTVSSAAAILTLAETLEHFTKALEIEHTAIILHKLELPSFFECR